MKSDKKTREPYEKPKIVIEKVELAGVAGQYPIPQLQPFFGLCPPCSP